jgi:cation diffusion facilitator CzcD-associated flavoprotein CzcO
MLVLIHRKRYPGCQCDIPSHNYAYSFDPKSDWPGYYATSEQIFDYMKEVSRKHGCDDLFAFGHEVVAATWNDGEGVWDLIVKADGKEFKDSCHVLINAAGVLKCVCPFLGRALTRFFFTNLGVAAIGSGRISQVLKTSKEN